jgi:excisionase family DNA binding protein
MVADRFLTRRQAAEFLSLSQQTLAVWAMTGKILPYVKLGRAVRYRLSDLEELIARQTIGGGKQDRQSIDPCDATPDPVNRA